MDVLEIVVVNLVNVYVMYYNVNVVREIHILINQSIKFQWVT